jgi:hypothetical protein
MADVATSHRASYDTRGGPLRSQCRALVTFLWASLFKYIAHFLYLGEQVATISFLLCPHKRLFRGSIVRSRSTKFCRCHLSVMSSMVMSLDAEWRVGRRKASTPLVGSEVVRNKLRIEFLNLSDSEGDFYVKNHFVSAVLASPVSAPRRNWGRLV